MTHVRKQIRDAVKTLLLNTTTARSSVFGARRQRYEAGETPAIEIRIDDEQAERLTADMDLRREMKLSLTLVAHSTGADDVQDILDALAEEIETIMDGGITNVFDMDYSGASFEDAREGAEEYAFLTLEYDLQVHTTGPATFS